MNEYLWRLVVGDGQVLCNPMTTQGHSTDDNMKPIGRLSRLGTNEFYLNM